MPSRLPVPASDINVWGLCYNDAHYPVIGQAQFNVVLNANNPPTVQAGTKFYVFNETAFTTAASPVTGNNVYPAATSVNNLQDTGVIFELVDRTFTWATGNFPTKVNSTIYYLYCSAAEDIDPTSRGRGVYGASTTAPVWNEIKQGWYSADGRVIARFYINSSGNLINMIILDNKLKAFGVIDVDAAAVTISGLDLEADGGVYDIYADLKSDTSAYMSVYFNGNETDANYLRTQTYTAAGIRTDSVGADALMAYVLTGEFIPYYFKILYTQGDGGTTRSPYAFSYGPNGNQKHEYMLLYTSSGMTNITSLEFKMSSGNLLAGTIIKVYKK